MKFTLKWLKEYLDTNATLEQISEKLTALGLEVEDITDRAASYKDFVIADVIECDPHPDADRLKQCLVSTGKEQMQVVCGAPNVRKGLRVVFALPGAVIPSNGLVLKKTTIRGVESNGMICSEAELKLSDEAQGILELPKDAKVGETFVQYMGFDDPVIEINLTPNRSDAAGVYGIARDLSASGLGKLKAPPQQPVPGGFASPTLVHIKDTKACPLFIGRTIRGVKNGPSPKWLQDYLRAVGSRPISALVDITNFICLGLNRPLHVFDADKLNGDITVRLAKDGEDFTDLKNVERKLDSNDIVVTDKNGVQALAGVIGGATTGCSDDTVNVFLECALFDPSHIRATGKKYGIDSDAKYRFERGVDPAFCDEGIEIATRMILDFCGGEPSYTTLAGAEPQWLRTIPFNPDMVATLGGMNMDTAEQMDILMKLGCQVRSRPDDLLDVTPPSWRHDVQNGADLVEEILRLKGYDAIPSVEVRAERGVTVSALNPEQKRNSDLRRVLASRGMHEAVTWSFQSEAMLEQFSYTEQKQMRLANPISADLAIMRHSILPGLLVAAKRNADRKIDSTHLFEQGSVYFGSTPETQPTMLAALRSGKGKTHWQKAANTIDFFSIKADLWALLQQAGLNTDTLTLSREAPRWYHPGQSATIRIGKNLLAHCGVLHPGLLQTQDIDFPVAAFEIFLGQLPPLKNKKAATKAALQLSALQPVTRDFAFLVANDVPAENILKAARNADKNLVADVVLFDVYAGKGVPEGQRSLAITVTLQPVKATLTDAEIEAVAKNIVGAVEKLGGVLRG